MSASLQTCLQKQYVHTASSDGELVHVEVRHVYRNLHMHVQMSGVCAGVIHIQKLIICAGRYWV